MADVETSSWASSKANCSRSWVKCPSREAQMILSSSRTDPLHGRVKASKRMRSCISSTAHCSWYNPHLWQAVPWSESSNSFQSLRNTCELWARDSWACRPHWANINARRESGKLCSPVRPEHIACLSRPLASRHLQAESRAGGNNVACRRCPAAWMMARSAWPHLKF